MATKKKAVKAKKQETKPEKIWISMIMHGGIVKHIELSEGVYPYEDAIKVGNYTLDEQSCEKSWGCYMTLVKMSREHIKDGVLAEVEINFKLSKSIKSVKKTAKKVAKKVKPKSKKK